MSEIRDDDAAQAPQVYAKTRHGKLSLDEIAGIMPGLGSLMPIISDRFGWMAHAARGGNWKLAAYQLGKVRHLFKVGRTTRPKWAEVIDEYLRDSLDPVASAIQAADLPAFEAAVAAAIDVANRIHRERGYGYIVYKLPPAGPGHMELGPVEEGD